MGMVFIARNALSCFFCCTHDTVLDFISKNKRRYKPVEDITQGESEKNYVEYSLELPFNLSTAYFS